jgi:hypothetical protein
MSQVRKPAAHASIFCSNSGTGPAPSKDGGLNQVIRSMRRVVKQVLGWTAPSDGDETIRRRQHAITAAGAGSLASRTKRRDDQASAPLPPSSAPSPGCPFSFPPAGSWYHTAYGPDAAAWGGMSPFRVPAVGQRAMAGCALDPSSVDPAGRAADTAAFGLASWCR